MRDLCGGQRSQSSEIYIQLQEILEGVESHQSYLVEEVQDMALVRSSFIPTALRQNGFPTRRKVGYLIGQA